jgi:hypothetical protein
MPAWLATIPQDIVIFIDEYEKIFGESDSMLGIMDGALTSKRRRLFLLTTNNLRVNENMLQRPSRIRYVKKFGDLSPEVVTEIVNDCLVHPELIEKTITFCSSLEQITVDIVKAVCEEVNIHHEDPENFADVFNVRKIPGFYSISIYTETGWKILKDRCKLNIRLDDSDRDFSGSDLDVDGFNLGEFRERLAPRMFSVDITELLDYADDEELEENAKRGGFKSFEESSAQFKVELARQYISKYFDEITGLESSIVPKYDEKGMMVIRVDEALTQHRSFRYANAYSEAGLGGWGI